MAIWLLVAVEATRSSFKANVTGEYIGEVGYWLMYKKGDISGSIDPYVQIDGTVYLAGKTTVEGYLIIALTEDLHLLAEPKSGTERRPPCVQGKLSVAENLEYFTISQVSRSYSVDINKTGVYGILYIQCSKITLLVDLEVTVVNPYGYLPGELYQLYLVISI